MKSQKVYRFDAPIWLYHSDKASWRFITVPQEYSQVIKERFSKHKRGWGSLRVQVMIGKTEWKTSIFPDKRLGSYILPIKSDVRRKEDIHDGDFCTVKLTLEIP